MDKSQRDTDIWLREKKNLESPGGPGYYEFQSKRALSIKESFNFGKIPFGSGIDRNKIRGSCFVGGNLESPGPTAYDKHDGAFTSKFLGNTSSFKSKSPKLSYINTNNSFLETSSSNQSRNVFPTIKKQQQQSMIEGIQGQPKQAHQRSLLGESRIKQPSYNNYNNQTANMSYLTESAVASEQTHQYLYNIPNPKLSVMASILESDDNTNSQNFTEGQAPYVSTKYLKSLKVSGGKSPSQSTFKNLNIKTPANNDVQKLLRNPQQPMREVAFQANDTPSNIKEESQVIVGPGSYEVSHKLVLRQSPSVVFVSPIKTTTQSLGSTLYNKSIKKQVEEYLQGVLGRDEKSQTRNLQEKGDQILHISTKQTGVSVFKSQSDRTDFTKQSITPGPGAYQLKLTTDIGEKLKKDQEISNVNFGSYSQRDTGLFTRNAKFPFNDQTSKRNPPIGAYNVDQSNRTTEVKPMKPKTLSPTNTERVRRVIQEKKEMMNLPGPGQYDPIQAGSIIEKNIRNLSMDIPFETKTPRFKPPSKDSQQDSKHQAMILKSINMIDPHAPYKIENQQSSFFKSKTSRVHLGIKPEVQTQQEKIVDNQQRREIYDDQQKARIINQIKQDYHGVGFNGTSPRFKEEGKVYRISGINNCPILGPAGVAEKLGYISPDNYDGSYVPLIQITDNGSSKIGPGSYNPNDSIFDKKSTRNNAQGTSSFLVPDRENKSYLVEAVSSKVFLGDIGAHHQEKSFIKKTFNAGLLKEQFKAKQRNKSPF